MKLLDRYCGALVGVLAGDALGAPYEHQKAAAIQKDLARRGGLVPFDYLDPWEKKRHVTRGQPTDDSELTACLGLSLGKYPMFDAVDAYFGFRDFIHGRQSVLTDGPAYGSGGTLRAALKPASYAQSLDALEKGEMPVIPSNGSLMRCAPVALCCHGDLDRTIWISQRQSCITHVHPVAQATCVVYAVMMSKLLEGYPPMGAWRKTQDILFHHEYKSSNPMLTNILSTAMYVEPSEDRIWPKTGGAFISLWIALWALLSATSFKDGITKAISVGGDTDTYAAIAGGLLGATYGIEGIPCEWRDVLIGREKMEAIATRLYEVAKK